MAWDAGGFDEGCGGIGEIGCGADEVLGFEVGGEFGPALEAVVAGDDELGVGESEAGGTNFVEGKLVELRMDAPDVMNRIDLPSLMGVQEVFGLFSVLLKVGTGG